MSKKFLIFLLLPTLYFLFSGSAEAARVYFDPQPTIYKVGDSFTLSVVLDTEGQPINAVDISILAPKLLKIKNISKNGSVIQLWVNEPSFSGRTINLTGGIPGGTTTSKGTIAKISFEAAAVGEGNLAFAPGSAVLLNDGQGTKLDLQEAGGPVFQVVPRPKETATVSPEPALSPEPEKAPAKAEIEEKDGKKPEKFKILIGEDSRIFDSQKFISFFTTDKDSGVDRYEVKEGSGAYKTAQSPYLLTDQKLKTVIRVRAYDAVGNYKESVYPGFLKRVWWQLLKVLDLFG